MSTGADLDELERQIVAASRRDAAAWEALQPALERRLERILAEPRFLGAAGRSSEIRLAISNEVIARLAEAGFRRLRLYVAARRDSPALTLSIWLHVVAKRVGVDYLRDTGTLTARKRHD